MVENFTVFGRTFSAYMLMALLGMLTAGAVTMRLAKKRGENENDYLTTLLWGAVGALAGGHILYGITNAAYIPGLIQNWGTLWDQGELMDTLVAIFGGSVFYGGLLGGLFAAFLYCRITKKPLSPMADLGAVAIPLFHAFGRVGCFLSGCCYGVPWEYGPVYAHSAVDAANGVPRFPVQLLEAAFVCCLFAFLCWLYRKQKQTGRLLSIYLLLYTPARFLLEFLRGDEYRGFLLGLSTSQFISVLLFIAGAAAYARTLQKQNAGAVS